MLAQREQANLTTLLRSDTTPAPQLSFRPGADPSGQAPNRPGKLHAPPFPPRAVFRPRRVPLSDGRVALIRRARGPDAREVIAHVNAVGAEGIYLMTERLALTPAQERAVFRRADGKVELYLVAVVAGTIAGTANFARGSQTKNRHVANLGVALRKDVRGLGLGTAMMEAGMGWARSVGVRKLTLGVFATNRPARRLYRRLGFTVEGRLRNQVVLRGASVDEILMARRLPTRIASSPRRRRRTG